jgi:N-carbamoylputrescine amidase
MPGTVRCALIQAKNVLTDAPFDQIKKAMLDKHIPMIEEAGKKGVQIICFQELFNGPYFPPAQDPKWYDFAEPVPGPTSELLSEYARRFEMAMVVSVFEEEMTGVFYNTCFVLDADGSYLGKYRKIHIPQVAGIWEKFYFKPGNLGFQVFQTAYAKVAPYICYDRHFPDGARIIGLKGAEILFNPSATVAGLSQHLWKLEQPAHAVANGYFVGAINRVGTEEPWNIGRFYGTSYFCDPRGQILAEASEDNDELLIADLDLDMIREVRKVWQFFRDRRPETYGEIVEHLP